MAKVSKVAQGKIQGVSKVSQETSKDSPNVPKGDFKVDKGATMRKPCQHCGLQYSGNYFVHMKEKHREVLQAQMAKANEVRFAKKAQGNGNGNHAETPPRHVVEPEGLEGIPDGDLFPVEEKPKTKPAAAKNPATIPTTTLTPGVQVRVIPKAFTMTSDILWQAMAALQNEKGWPKMDPGDFADTVFHEFCRVNYGIILGGYAVVEKNGERKYTAEEVRSIAATAVENALKQLQEVSRAS